MTNGYVGEFHDSMNEHGNAQYKSVTGPGRGQGFVVELERHKPIRGGVRAHLRVWRRPNRDPRKANWTKVFNLHDEWEDAKEVYDSIQTKEDVADLRDPS